MRVHRFIRTCVAIGAIAAIAACAANGNSTVPPITQKSLGANTLQFAVGTANVGQDGNAPGLNVVATLRQPNGLTGVLASTPKIQGPAGFLVPAGMGGAYGPGNVDAGTGHISSSPQVSPVASVVNSTLGTFTGAFGYGFGPFNSDSGSAVNGAYYPGNPNATLGNGFTSSAYDGTSEVVAAAGGGGDPTQPLPFYGTKLMIYLGGPPAYGFFNDGVTQPRTFSGYAQGFADFETPPVAGTYTLSVPVSPTNASAVTYTKSATLANTTLLGAIPAPTFTEDGKGGGTGTVVVSDARVSETMVYIVDATAGLYFSVGPLRTHGTLTFKLPDTLGACVGVGCQSGTGATPSIATGDAYLITAVGYDYPTFEAGPPNSSSATPKITGANGQADLTSSIIVGGAYGGGGVAPVSKIRRNAIRLHH
jgi:hypothetical protein